MKFFRNLFLGFGIALISTCAWAQSTPNLSYGDVPTAAQWNSFFAAKQDVLGYVPLNSAGGIMTGELTTAASATTSAGFNLPQGLAPTSPVNGDIWTTSSGFFVRIAGTTIGPIGTLACPTCVVNNTTNTFTAYQIINLNAAAVPTVATGSVLQLTQADTTVGRVEMDTFGAAAVFTGFRADGTNASPTGLVVDDEIVAVNAWGYDATARSTSASASMRAYAGGTWSNTSHPTYIDFSTTAVASTTLTSRAHIENDGGVTIGGVASQGSGSINLLNGVFNNGVAPTGTGGYVRATSAAMSTPTISNPTLTGTVTGPGTVPNVVLVNSSITVGSTSIPLGGTAATLAGLTLTAPTINGAALSGTISGTPALSGANFVTLANIVQDATAWSLMGNASGSAANYAPFTIGGLTQKVSPAGSDLVLIQDQAASGAFKFALVSAIAAGATVASVGGLTGVIGLGPNLQAVGSNIQETQALIGKIEWIASTRPPPNYLIANGSSQSRSTFALLFANIVFSSTVTFTNTSAAIGWSAHGLSAGDNIKFFTTGGLPTNFTAGTHGLITAGTSYCVSATGLTTNTFEVSATCGGSPIVAGSAGSGTQTAVNAPWGDGDGSTTFTLPALAGEFVRAWDAGVGIDNNRMFGSDQLDAFQGHWHNKTDPGHNHTYSQSGAGGGSPFQVGSGLSGTTAVTSTSTTGITVTDPTTDGVNGTPRTATETRPRNKTLLAVIRYQ